MTAQHATPFWGPEFDDLGEQDPEMHGTPAGDAELAEVAAVVSALVARAPADPRP